MKLKDALIVVNDRDTVRDFKVTSVRRDAAVAGDVWMDKNDNALVTDAMFSETVRTKLHNMIDEEFGPAPEKPIMIGQEDFEDFINGLSLMTASQKFAIINDARDELFDVGYQYSELEGANND